MANINSLFPSAYLKAADVKEKPIVGAIDKIKMEEIGDDRKMCPVLYFKNIERGLVLNKTNAAMIADLYGEETDDWEDEAIEMHCERVPFAGKMVDSIRVRKPSKKKKKVVEVDDDEIPY